LLCWCHRLEEVGARKHVCKVRTPKPCIVDQTLPGTKMCKGHFKHTRTCVSAVHYIIAPHDVSTRGFFSASLPLTTQRLVEHRPHLLHRVNPALLVRRARRPVGVVLAAFARVSNRHQRASTVHAQTLRGCDFSTFDRGTLGSDDGSVGHVARTRRSMLDSDDGSVGNVARVRRNTLDSNEWDDSAVARGRCDDFERAVSRQDQYCRLV